MATTKKLHKDDQQALNEQNSTSNLKLCDVSGIANLFMNKHLSDFTVYIGFGKDKSWKFPVHKLVLSATSPVFTSMFNGNYLENLKREVIIRDIAPYTFYKLLVFVYKGILDVLSISETLNILRAADKYEIDKLKNACVEKMLTMKITNENFWDLFENYLCFDSQLISTEMKINMFLFLDQNAASIVKHEKFLLLDQDNILKIISRPTLKVKEIDLFDALLVWSTMQCANKHMELTLTNQRQILGDTIYYIRFLTDDILKHRLSTIFSLLTLEERELMFTTPQMLPQPWDVNWLKTDRESKYLISNDPDTYYLEMKYSDTCDREMKYSDSIYLVFAKDAFIHNIEFAVNPDADYAEENEIKVFIRALKKNDDSEKISLKYEFEENLKIFSIYVKAFTVYKLEIISLIESFLLCEKNVWGKLKLPHANNERPFYSVLVNAVKDLHQFQSTDYWRSVFVGEQQEVDENVISSQLSYSPLMDISVTFC